MIGKAIKRLRPDAHYVIRGDKLKWLDKKQPKPTEKEIADEIAFLESDEYKNELWRSSTSLSRRKFKIGISLYEIEGETLKTKIESALESLPEPHKTIAKVSYEDGTEFDRMDEMVVMLSQEIGLSDEEVDDFFEWAMNEGWR